MAEKKSIFETLNAINVNEHTEKKNGLTYLSWAWAISELFKHYPKSSYEVIRDEQTGYNYHTDGKTAWVETSVTVRSDDETKTLGMWLPVMNFKNQSIPVDSITSTDVNKALMRCITKNISVHGLGFYIYAGEDLPEEEQTPLPDMKQAKKAVDNYTDESLVDAATVNIIKEALKKAGKSEKGCLEYYNVKDFSELKVKQATMLLKSLGVK